MEYIKLYIRDTLKIFLALIALIAIIATGLLAIALIAYGVSTTQWLLALLGLFLLSGWIAFMKKESKNE